MRSALFILLIFLSTSAIGQISYTVSARLVDNDTQDPLVYASVFIKGRKISTISNSQGFFDFHVPQNALNDTLVVSMLGYRNFTTITSALVNDPNSTIQLERDVIVLEEVVISDTLTPGDIVRIALNKIVLNFPMEPYGMEGFYRDLKTVDGQYVSLLEAALQIFDKGYKDPRNPIKLKERVSINEIRKSIGYDKISIKWFDQTNLLEDLLLHNNVKYRTFPREEIFFQVLQLQGYTAFNGKPVYIIGYDDEYSLRVFVEMGSYSIVRVEFEIGDGESPIRVDKKNKKKANEIMRIKRILEFQEYGGKNYLQYLNVETETVWKNYKNNKVLANTKLFQELLVNKIETEDYEMISSAQKMKSFGLQYQDKPYNSDFWKSYNVIKDSPLEEAVVKDLEIRMPLEQQFEKN